jgi:hypothetical protein
MKKLNINILKQKEKIKKIIALEQDLYKHMKE